MIDVDYDFSKMKNIFVIAPSTSTIPTESETIIRQDDTILLEKASKKYVKKMKCHLVAKEIADALLEIKIVKWKSEVDHHEDERTVIRKFYVGYKEVEIPFHRPPPPPHGDRRGRYGSEHGYRPPPLPRKHRVWTTSATWFPGSREVVEKNVIPAHDVYRSEVTALFELRDAKSGKLIMSNARYGSSKWTIKSTCSRSFVKGFARISERL